MKIKYEKNKGNRIKHKFIMMGTFDDYWWNIDLKKWEHSDLVDFNKYQYESDRNCHSIRAFRRMLRSAPNVGFYLFSKCQGFDAFGKGGLK